MGVRIATALWIGLAWGAAGCFGSDGGGAGAEGTSAGSGATVDDAGAGLDPGARRDAGGRRGSATPPVGADAAAQSFGSPNAGRPDSGAADAGTSPGGEPCATPGLIETGCVCPEGSVGERRCGADGGWSECTCSAPSEPTCAPGQQVVCTPCAGELQERMVVCGADGSFDCSCGPALLGEPCETGGCSAGLVCTEGLCSAVCNSDAACQLLREGAVCASGQCLLACIDATQCPPGLACVTTADAVGACRLGP